MKSTSNHSSQSKILHLIKTGGPMGAADLARKLQMTSMGARQHMQLMEAQGLLEHEFISRGKGRPKKQWKLTAKAQSQFPDRHSALLVNLIGQMQTQLGDAAFETLIQSRERQMFEDYKRQLSDSADIKQKLMKLAEIRSDEGYMSEAIIDNDKMMLVENHCPICEAAKQCQQFCRSELKLFEQLLGCKIERSEYLLAGARRCAYLIDPKFSVN